MYNAHPKAKCWECGKQISNLTSLISHYQSHDIKATCHICRITFRRLTSLSTHLDNAHSPPICKKCRRSFSNVWELNKHAETPCVGSASLQQGSALISVVKCERHNGEYVFNEVTAHRNKNSVVRDSASEWRPDQRAEMKPKRPETSDNSVEYIVGEDDNDLDMESDKADDSSSSESDDEDDKHCKQTDLCPGDSESDGDSSSTDDSSESSNSPLPKTPPAPPPPPDAKSLMCTACGRGPFRSIKLHLRHCNGVRMKYQCFLCKKVFPNEAALNEHLMPLYSCHICGQVFSHENLYFGHQCPKGSKSSLVLFCSESLPKTCNICKSFFSSEKTLLDHITRVHMSVVSTKVRIITDPSALANKKVAGGVQRTEAQPAVSNTANQAVNGKVRADQACPASAVVKSSPSSLSTSSNDIVSPATPDKPRNHSAPNKPTSQPSSDPCLTTPPAATDTTPDAVASSDSAPPSSPTILAMFENDSKDVALMKRMNTGWRSKAPHPCRQCGAILRQPSLVISHRYLHRGRRSHRCQCGRAFKHRLHLLRHCIQHAEAVSYICVDCGDTFTGANLLAQHLTGESLKKSCSGRMWKSKGKTKCRMPFTCDCGLLFFRPSAYIWHQLQNRTKSKQLKKPVK